MDSNCITGFNAVSALFHARPQDVQRLFFTQPMAHHTGAWCKRLALDKRPYRLLSPEDMARAAGTLHHGGICAVAKRRWLHSFTPDAFAHMPLVLALDGIGNPHNLGAIARSACYFGVRALLLHIVEGAALPCDAAYRTAEGALEYLDIYTTRDLAATLRVLAPRFRSLAATLSRTATGLNSLPRDRDMILVLGHEEHGISPSVLAQCRRQVRIEGGGRIQSLNVAQAASVLLHGLAIPHPGKTGQTTGQTTG